MPRTASAAEWLLRGLLLVLLALLPVLLLRRARARHTAAAAPGATAPAVPHDARADSREAPHVGEEAPFVVATSAGVLSVTNDGHVPAMTSQATWQGQQLWQQTDSAGVTIRAVTGAPDHWVLLLELATSAADCPARYRVLDFNEQPLPFASDAFGTCSDVPAIEAAEGHLRVRFPSFQHAPSEVWSYTAAPGARGALRRESVGPMPVLESGSEETTALDVRNAVKIPPPRSAAVAGASAGFDRAWWMGLDHDGRAAFAAGFQDCSLTSSAPFWGNYFHMEAAVTGWYSRHADSTDNAADVLAAHYRQPAEKAVDGAEGDDTGPHSFYTGDFWLRLSRAERVRHVQGYLACQQHFGTPVDVERAANYAARTSSYFQKASAGAAASLGETPIADALARWERP